MPWNDRQGDHAGHTEASANRRTWRQMKLGEVMGSSLPASFEMKRFGRSMAVEGWGIFDGLFLLLVGNHGVLN